MMISSGLGPATVEFVTIMAESAPLLSTLTAKSDRTAGMEVPNKDTGMTVSMPGQSSLDSPARASTQDGAMAVHNDGSTGLALPDLPDPAYSVGTGADVLTAPVPPPIAPQTPHEPLVAAKPLSALSLAAMAFSDRSVAAQPSAAKPNLAPFATDDPAFPATHGSTPPQAAWREGVFPVSGEEIELSAMIDPDIRHGSGQTTALPSSSARSPVMSLPQRETLNQLAADVMTHAEAKTDPNTQGSPERPIPQALAAAAEGLHSPRQQMVTEASPSSAEWPLQSSVHGSTIVSNMAETPPVRQNQSNAHPPGATTSASPFALTGAVPNAPQHQSDRFQPGKAATLDASRLRSRPTDAQPAPFHAPRLVQVEPQPVAQHVATAGSQAGHAVGDAGMMADLRPYLAAPSNFLKVPHVIQSAVSPAADLKLPQAGPALTELNVASAPMAQEAPLAGRDTSTTSAAGTAEKPHFVTNIAEIRAHPQNPDPGSPVLSALAAEADLGPQKDDPAPSRAVTAPLPLTAEILRLVPTTPNGPVTLTLRPEELGTLRFEVTQTEHGLHIHLSVEQPQTLDLLRRQGEQLLADLRQAGFAGASLSFAGEGAQDAPPQQREQPQESLYPSGTTPGRDNASLHPPRLAPPGTLDLRL